MLTKCPECSHDVSDKASQCPNCGVQIRKPRRGFFGAIFKWGFILFNIVMVMWLFSYWGSIVEVAQEPMSSAEEAGVAIGTTIGTGMLLSIWVFGDIILGLFVLFTKPK